MWHQQNYVNLVKAVVGFTALAMAMPAMSVPCGGVMFARTSQMSVPCGWYLEANVGYAKLTNTNLPGSLNTQQPGGNINLGYKFMPYVGLEIGYTLYPYTRVTDPFTDTTAAKARFYSYDIAGRGILPISDSGFEFFAKVGAQRLVNKIQIENDIAANDIGLTKSTRRATGLFVGLGGQYYFMPEVAAVVQWQRATGNNSTGNIDFYSVGVSFIFD